MRDAFRFPTEWLEPGIDFPGRHEPRRFSIEEMLVSSSRKIEFSFCGLADVPYLIYLDHQAESELAYEYFASIESWNRLGKIVRDSLCPEMLFVVCQICMRFSERYKDIVQEKQIELQQCEKSGERLFDELSQEIRYGSADLYDIRVPLTIANLILDQVPDERITHFEDIQIRGEATVEQVQSLVKMLPDARWPEDVVFWIAYCGQAATFATGALCNYISKGCSVAAGQVICRVLTLFATANESSEALHSLLKTDERHLISVLLALIDLEDSSKLTRELIGRCRSSENKDVLELVENFCF